MKKSRIACAFTMSLSTALLTTRVYAAGADNPTPDLLQDCRQTKDLNRAIAACSEVIRAGSKDAKVYVSRAYAYILKNDYDHALADCEEAIRLNPKDAVAFRHRGEIYRVRGDDDRAIADLTKALSLDSNDTMALVDLGNIYASQGATAKAIADFSAAIQIDADKTFGGQLAHLNRGIVYLYDGALDKAHADFKKITELDPKEPFFAIWLHIAQSRAHSPSTFASVVPNLHTTAWSLPFVRLYLGEETPEAFLASVRASVGTKPHGMCDADFYVAEFNYLQNKHDEAVRFYRAAHQDC